MPRCSMMRRSAHACIMCCICRRQKVRWRSCRRRCSGFSACRHNRGLHVGSHLRKLRKKIDRLSGCSSSINLMRPIGTQAYRGSPRHHSVMIQRIIFRGPQPARNAGCAAQAAPLTDVPYSIRPWACVVGFRQGGARRLRFSSCPLRPSTAHRGIRPLHGGPGSPASDRWHPVPLRLRLLRAEVCGCSATSSCA